MNTDRYLDVLKLFWAALGRKRNINRVNQWFMQDPHVSIRSLAWLTDHFDDRLISRRSQYVWAPHSPDLNPCDYFLWGCLKDRVFQNQFESIERLKEVIVEEVGNISREMCQAAVQNFTRRIQECLKIRWGHIEHRI